MSERSNEHLGAAANDSGQYAEMEALRAAYAEDYLRTEALDRRHSAEARAQLNDAASSVGEKAAVSFDTAKNRESLRQESAREALRILHGDKVASEKLAYDAKDLRDDARTPENNLNSVQKRLLDESADAIAAKYQDLPDGPDKDAKIQADGDEAFNRIVNNSPAEQTQVVEASLAVEPTVATEVAAQPSPEATVEKTYSPEQLAQLSKSTVEIHTSIDMTDAEKQAYIKAAAAKGITVSGSQLQGSGGGWQSISERPQQDRRIEAIAESDASKAYEKLKFLKTGKQDSNGEAIIEVLYAATPGMKAERFQINNEIGYAHPDGSGRPGNVLNVSFELPESAAKFIGKQAAENPASVRAAVEAIVLESGMPPEVWYTPAKPSVGIRYGEPKPGYRIGITGGEAIGAEDYEQNLK